jgi:hypothetical protein
LFRKYSDFSDLVKSKQSLVFHTDPKKYDPRTQVMIRVLHNKKVFKKEIFGNKVEIIKPTLAESDPN